MQDAPVQRLRTLPQRPRETWQGGLVRSPGWVKEPGRRPYRTVVPIWTSLQTGAVHLGETSRPEDLDPGSALAALVDFACDEGLAGYRPGRLEVNEPALAERLGEALRDLSIAVVHRESLLAVDRQVESMIEYFTGWPKVPGPLEAPGVTIEGLRAFADAAREFFLAAPWQHLEDVDLIRFETPVPEPGLKFCSVLGASRRTFGLVFFQDAEDLWQMHRDERPATPRNGVWMVTFEEIHEIPLADADLWLDHDLPLAGERAYAFAILLKPGRAVRRAGPAVLTFLEAVLRTLAGTTEEEIDRARWSKRVAAAGGPVEVGFTLPDLIEPPDRETLLRRGIEPEPRATEHAIWRIHQHLKHHPPANEEEMRRAIEPFMGRAPGEIEFKPQTPLEEAQEICYQAFDALGRRRFQLAREALRICPDCADAHVLVAERCAGVDEAHEQYVRAVDAGSRSLGPEAFREDEGRFWGEIDTRPYMRARSGLAECLESLGRTDEAAGHYQEMLRLNPDDNQGIRYRLLPILLRSGRDEEAEELLDRYEEEVAAMWAYGRALLAFRRGGDGDEARSLLAWAAKVNAYVPHLLCGEPPADMPTMFAPGSREEAIRCALQQHAAWKETPGALEWLARRAP